MSKRKKGWNIVDLGPQDENPILDDENIDPTKEDNGEIELGDNESQNKEHETTDSPEQEEENTGLEVGRVEAEEISEKFNQSNSAALIEYGEQEDQQEQEVIENEFEQDQDPKKSNRVFFFIVVALLLCAFGYFISCQVFNYCLITPISQKEIDDYNNEKSTIGEPASKLLTWYLDSDNDGFGELSAVKQGENQPAGYVSNGIDDCPNLSGPKCTFGCPDINNNCIKDIDEDLNSHEPPAPVVVSNPINIVPEVINGATNGSGIDKTDQRDERTELPPAKLTTYFADFDNDGLGDKNNIKEASEPPKGYVENNSSDDCPSRAGSNNGCPTLSIDAPVGLYINKTYRIKSILEGQKQTDNFQWEGKNIEFTSKKGSIAEINSKVVGWHRVNLEVSNAKDGYSDSKNMSVQFKITNEYLASKLMDLATYGNYVVTGLTGKLKKDRDVSIDFLESSIENINIGVKKQNKGKRFNTTYGKLKNELTSAKRSVSTKINSIEIVDVQYDEYSGKINSFTYKLN